VSGLHETQSYNTIIELYEGQVADFLLEKSFMTPASHKLQSSPPFTTISFPNAFLSNLESVIKESGIPLARFFGIFQLINFGAVTVD
jgi:hypothetical protein